MLHWLQNPSSLFFDLYYKHTEYQQDSFVNKRLNYQQLDGFVNLWGWEVIARSDGAAMRRTALFYLILPYVNILNHRT